MEKGRQSTSEEVVEAVARAMRRAMTAVDCRGEGSEFVAFIDIEAGARAAIAAMPSILQESDAEVTEAMESAGAHIIAMSSYAIIQKLPRGLAKQVYTAMTSARDRRGDDGRELRAVI